MNFKLSDFFRSLTALTCRTETFVDKAFEELEGLHRFMCSTTPAAQINLIKRAHQIIDVYVDRPASVKNELKAVVVLAHGAPFMFDDITRFKSRYNAHVSDMVQALVEGNLTEDMAQIEMVMIAAEAEAEAANLKNPELRERIKEEVFPPEQMADMLQQYTNNRMKSVYQSASELLGHETMVVNALYSGLKQLREEKLPGPAQSGNNGLTL
mgnify:FL=1